jgi:hypothetical protein
MFGKMLDGTMKTAIDGFGVYLVSTILLVGLSTVLVHVLGMVGVGDGGGSVFAGGGLYTLIGTGFVLILSSLILHEKHLTGDLYSVILMVIGIYLAYTTSVFLGLLPVALLTTMKIGGTTK